MKRQLEGSKTDDCIKEGSLPRKVGKSSQSHSLPITPQKMGNSCEEPLTPTANLKMLVSAAFGISNPGRQGHEKRGLFTDDNDDEFLEDSCSTVSDSTDDKPEEFSSLKPVSNAKDVMSNSRKLKSLGLLCKKFLSKYPAGSEGSIINLHEIAKELSVERRRIYDIVNVLESLEYVSKKGKNTYIWHGSSRLVQMLRKLKALAIKTYPKNKDRIEKDQSLAENNGTSGHLDVPTGWLNNIIPMTKDEREIENPSSCKQDEDVCRRKNKSLGVFCQKLIMLFMVSESHVIALDEAAKEVIEIEKENTEKNSKTKVRRLYDIANVLTSMGMIEKSPTYFGSRKAAFRWIGMNLDELEPDTEILDKVLKGEHEYFPTKHSIFCQPLSIEGVKQGSNASLRKLGTRSFSASNIDVKRRSKMPRTKSAATIVSRKRPSSETNDQEEDNNVKFAKSGIDRPKQLKCDRDDPNAIDESEPHLELAAKANTIELTSNIGAESPIRLKRIESETISPNERNFQEAIRTLRQRFPDKLHDETRLLELLRAGNEIEMNEPALEAGYEKGSRCNLLERIASTDSNVTSTKSAIESCGETSKGEVGSKQLSMKSFKVIVDQLKDSKKEVTLRLGIEEAVNTSNQNEASHSWNRYPYHVSPTVQKVSIGVQASLLDGVIPLKPLSHSPDNRGGEVDSVRTVTSPETNANSEICHPETPNSSPKTPVTIPVYTTTAVTTTLSRLNAKQSNSYFLVGFKPNQTPQLSRHPSDVLSLTPSNSGILRSSKGKANEVNSFTPTSHCKGSMEDVIKMVSIPPTPIDFGNDKENCNPSGSPSTSKLKTQAASSVVPQRILLPLKILNGDTQRCTAPFLLPKNLKEEWNEETPTRFESRDNSQVKPQRILSNLPL